MEADQDAGDSGDRDLPDDALKQHILHLENQLTLQTVKLTKLQAENKILIDKSNKLKKVEGEKRSLKAEVDQLKTKKAVNDNNSTKLILLEKQNQSLESQLKDEKNITQMYIRS